MAHVKCSINITYSFYCYFTVIPTSIELYLSLHHYTCLLTIPESTTTSPQICPVFFLSVPPYQVPSAGSLFPSLCVRSDPTSCESTQGHTPTSQGNRGSAQSNSFIRPMPLVLLENSRRRVHSIPSPRVNWSRCHREPHLQVRNSSRREKPNGLIQHQVTSWGSLGTRSPGSCPQE